MSKSILQPDEKYCFITGSRINLEKHHVYHGPRRKAAEKWGCWVWLRSDVHADLHDRNKELDKYLQQVCQTEFEKTHTRAEFISIFGKSYL